MFNEKSWYTMAIRSRCWNMLSVVKKIQIMHINNWYGMIKWQYVQPNNKLQRFMNIDGSCKWYGELRSYNI